MSKPVLKVTKIKVTPKQIQKLANVLSVTNLDLDTYHLVSEQKVVTGFQFFEDDHSIHKVSNVLAEHPVLSNVKTDQFEKIVYQVADLWVEACYFFSKENRGTFLVLCPISNG